MYSISRRGTCSSLAASSAVPAAPVSLHEADHDVFTTAAAADPFAQHAECLAYAGRVAQKDLQPSALLLFFAGQQPVFGRFSGSSPGVFLGSGTRYNLPMNSRRTIAITRWMLASGALAGIVLVYRLWLHVNPTTVALTLLLYILVLAAEWGLRYAVAVSLAATACYNFFFLPPIGTFTVADPQNWLALVAFLVTAILASRLSRARAPGSRRRQGAPT